MEMRTYLLASASLLAMTAHANAAPIAFIIGSAITSLATASPFVASLVAALFPAGASAAAIGSAALSAVAFAGSIAAQALMRPKIPTQSIKNTVKGSEGPGIFAFGRVEIEGRIGFANTAGYNISRLALHAFGVLDGVEQYFYDGRETTVEADGNVSTPPWAKGGSPPSYMNVQTKAGDGTETAWSSLVSDFPGQWTTDHRARGIAQSLMRITSPGTASNKFGRLLQGGVKNIRLRARI